MGRPKNLLEAANIFAGQMQKLTANLAPPDPQSFALELGSFHHAKVARARLDTLDEWRAQIAATMPEDKGTESVQAHLYKWIKHYQIPYAYHTKDSRKSRKGYPDQHLIGHPGKGSWHVELKAHTGKFSDDQIECMVTMRLAGDRVTYLSPVDVFNGRMQALVASLAKTDR